MNSRCLLKEFERGIHLSCGSDARKAGERNRVGECQRGNGSRTLAQATILMSLFCMFFLDVIVSLVSCSYSSEIGVDDHIQICNLIFEIS